MRICTSQGEWEEPIELWCSSIWCCLYPPSIMSTLDDKETPDSYFVKSYNGKESASMPLVGEDGTFSFVVTEAKVCITCSIFT